MKSKTAVPTVATAYTRTTGRVTIDPSRTSPGITQGMREAAARVARVVLQETTIKVKK